MLRRTSLLNSCWFQLRDVPYMVTLVLRPNLKACFTVKYLHLN